MAHAASVMVCRGNYIPAKACPCASAEGKRSDETSHATLARSGCCEVIDASTQAETSVLPAAMVQVQVDRAPSPVQVEVPPQLVDEVPQLAAVPREQSTRRDALYLRLRQLLI